VTSATISSFHCLPAVPHPRRAAAARLVLRTGLPLQPGSSFGVW
jgi:hypothetical protein